MNDLTHGLQSSVNRRQHELESLERVLAFRARQLGRRSLIGRVVVIVSGAVIATQTVATQIAGSDSTVVVVLYAGLGVLVAAVAGLESALAWERHAAELRILSVEARNTRMIADSIWQQDVAASEGEQRVQALKRVIEEQDGGLDKLHRQAAGLGIDVSLELDHHRATDDGGPFPA